MKAWLQKLCEDEQLRSVDTVKQLKCTKSLVRLKLLLVR